MPAVPRSSLCILHRELVLRIISQLWRKVEAQHAQQAPSGDMVMLGTTLVAGVVDCYFAQGLPWLIPVMPR